MTSSSAGVKVVPAYLAWTDDSGQARQFQCFVRSEDYDFASEVTRYPVETGSSKTDNVRVAPREAKVLFFETNAAIDENNWESPAAAMTVITVDGPPPALPPAPVEFEDYDGLLQVKGLVAGGVLQALGGLDDAIQTPGIVNAGVVIGAGLATGADVNEIGGDLVAGTTAIETAKYAAAIAVLEAPGEPVPDVQAIPAQPVKDLPQVINQQTLALPSAGQQTYVAQTIALLEQLWTDVQVVDLIAPHLVISSLVIEHIHIHRDADTGLGAEIEVSLSEIDYVSTTTVPAPAPSLPHAQVKQNLGEQNTGDAGPQTESVAHAALSALKGLL